MILLDFFERMTWNSVLIVISTAVSGCAVSYDDSLGHRHVLGLVDMSVIPAAGNDTLAGNVISLKSLGLHMSHHDGQTMIGLGYTNESTAGIRDNALVLGNPNNALSKFINGAQ